MRKAIKIQILQMLMTVKDAHKEMLIYLNKKQYENAKSILTDCQGCAVTIGNSIEQFENNQEMIIRQLEEYCERVFVISNEMEGAVKAVMFFGKKNWMSALIKYTEM